MWRCVVRGCFTAATRSQAAQRTLHLTSVSRLDVLPFSRTGMLRASLACRPYSTDGMLHIDPPEGVQKTAVDAPVEVGEDVIDTGIPFSRFGLPEELVEHLRKIGYTTAFDIQAQTLPHTLEGKDVIGRAITGSGKTLAFALPIVTTVAKSPRSRSPKAIVLTPTRELCNQVTDAIAKLSRSIRCLALYGGTSIDRQSSALYRGVDVVCCTPGRMNDHMRRGRLILDKVRLVILDEADLLLTPQFRDQIEDMLETVPEEKQMMLFSATMPPDVRQLTRMFMKNPVTVDLSPTGYRVPKSIEHLVMWMNRSSKKEEIIANLLKEHNAQRAIVFTPTKRMASALSDSLYSMGIEADDMHSDIGQAAREKRLRDFRKGYSSVIVATDVAARGIDVPEVDMVIQVHIPPSGIEYYIHRAGRTGRMGKPGKSVLLLHSEPESRQFLRQLKRLSAKLTYLNEPEETYDDDRPPQSRGGFSRRDSWGDFSGRSSRGGWGGRRDSFRDRRGSFSRDRYRGRDGFGSRSRDRQSSEWDNDGFDDWNSK